MKCNICQNEMYLNNDLNTCLNCGLICKEKIYPPNEQYKRYLSHNYDENYKEYMKRITKDINFDNKIVLDFGCGQNPCLSNIYKTAEFTNYDIFFFPSEEYKYKKYDLILMIEVIEHLEHPYEIINDLSDLLKEGGKIYIHTKLYNAKTDFKTWWYKRDITHITFFSEKTFCVLAHKIGLKCEIKDEFIVLSK